MYTDWQTSKPVSCGAAYCVQSQEPQGFQWIDVLCSAGSNNICCEYTVTNSPTVSTNQPSVSPTQTPSGKNYQKIILLHFRVNFFPNQSSFVRQSIK